MIQRNEGKPICLNTFHGEKPKPWPQDEVLSDSDLDIRAETMNDKLYDSNGSFPRSVSRNIREIHGIPAYVYPFMVLYFASLFFIAFIGFYVVPDILFIVSFIIILPNLRKIMRSPLVRRLRNTELMERLILIFLVALILRGILLFNDEIITNDIDLYVERSKAMVEEDQIPYVDEPMHKPPMYAYMLYLLGAGLGAGHIQFRAFFTLVDSWIAVMVYLMLRKKFGEGYSLYGGIAYALCPINVVSTGLEGHYEPLVSLFLIWAVILHLRNKVTASSLSLGIAFAFKLYPFIIAPFLIWKLRTWKERIWYSILFFIPMALSFLPLYLIDKRTWDIYWNYQGSEWMDQAMKSFAKAYELMALDLGRDPSILGITHTDFFMYLFLVIVGLMFLHWVWSRMISGRVEKHIMKWNMITKFIPKGLRSRLLTSLESPPDDRKQRAFLLWYKVIFITFVIYYGSQIVTGFLLYESDFEKNLGIEDPWLAMGSVAVLYFGISVFLLHRYRELLFPNSMKAPHEEELFILGAFAIMFLLFGSPDYPTWYIMWFIPLVLGIRTDRIRHLLFAIMLWNIPGEGIKLWPGKTLAEKRY